MRQTAWVVFLMLLSAVPTRAGDAERRAAIRRGIDALDQSVFRLPDAQGTPRKQFTVAVVGLVHLMREPRTGRRSPIPRLRDYLVRYVDEVERRVRDPDQLPRAHGLADSRRLIQYTWPLAQAGLFFGELGLRGPDRREALATLRRIAALLEDAQAANGGWGHGRINPRPPSEDRARLAAFRSTYPDTLLASSSCVAATLGLTAGLLGRTATPALERARAYYRAARLPNGSFPYDPSQRSAGFARTNAGRTAGAIFAQHCLGAARDQHFDRSVEYLLVNLTWVPEGHGSPCLNLMHGALACLALGERIFSRFRHEFEGRVLAAQGKDGAFACICERKAFGVTCDGQERLGPVFARSQRAYVTAIHTFVLLLEPRRLKILDQALPRASVTPWRR
ncbi:MAG: hypothetical protein ACYTFD_01820 [Planctomycetota bacterium]|jgi:hypothetical protein